MNYSDRFNNAVEFVFVHECVYDSKHNVIVENVPGDSGGPTKYGIDHASHPDVDIANLTADGAKKIYYDSYWCPVYADELGSPIGEFMFDTGVNNGIGYAVRVLQTVLGIGVDGRIGPVTLGEARRQDSQELFSKLVEARNQHYRAIVDRIPGDAKFLKGWLNRTEDLLAFGNKITAAATSGVA
jgi:lysozyme family protein